MGLFFDCSQIEAAVASSPLDTPTSYTCFITLLNYSYLSISISAQIYNQSIILLASVPKHTYFTPKSVIVIYFSVSALDGSEWTTSLHGGFTPGKRTHGSRSIGSRWTQSRPRSFAQEKNAFPLPGLESQIFKPNYAIPASPIYITVILSVNYDLWKNGPLTPIG